MYFYICIGLFLSAFASFDAFFRKNFISVYFSYLATLAGFLVFAGLRDDTGYDWYVYKGFFDDLNVDNGFYGSILYGSESGFEVGYSILMYVIKWFGFSYWGGQFIICAFNVYAFLGLNKYFDYGRSRGFFVYYCWLFLVLQMGVVRMSVALSFMFIFLVAVMQRKKFKACICVLGGAAFHVFVIAIAMLVIVSKVNIPKRAPGLVFAVLLALYFGSVDFLSELLRVCSAVLPGFISAKIVLYISQMELYQKGGGEFLYKILMVVGVLYLFHFYERLSEVQRIISRISFWYVVLLLVFWKYPIFHDRVKYFVLMPFFYVLFSILDGVGLAHRVAGWGVVVTLSLAVLYHQVSGPLFYPYTPYYNMIEEWLGDDSNDGEARTLRYYEEFNDKWGM